MRAVRWAPFVGVALALSLSAGEPGAAAGGASGPSAPDVRAVTLTSAGAIDITGSGFGSQPGYTGISGTPGYVEVQDAQQGWTAGYPGDTLTVRTWTAGEIVISRIVDAYGTVLEPAAGDTVTVVVWGTDGQQSAPYLWTVPASAGSGGGAAAGAGAPYPCAQAASAWNSLQQQLQAVQQSGAQAESQVQGALNSGAGQVEGLLQQASGAAGGGAAGTVAADMQQAAALIQGTLAAEVQGFENQVSGNVAQAGAYVQSYGQQAAADCRLAASTAPGAAAEEALVSTSLALEQADSAEAAAFAGLSASWSAQIATVDAELASARAAGAAGASGPVALGPSGPTGCAISGAVLGMFGNMLGVVGSLMGLGLGAGKTPLMPVGGPVTTAGGSALGGIAAAMGLC